MAYKIMNKNKVNKESQDLETARDKGVNSTDLLGNNNFIDEINRQYAAYYKYIGELKAKYQKKQNRRFLFLCISFVTWIFF